MTIAANRKNEFEVLLNEFRVSYPQTSRGKRHIALYSEARVSALDNYKHISKLHSAGKDITQEVLRKLLPHNDFKSNREAGAWINNAPAIKKDIVGWFENVGWTQPGDWPKVSLAIFELVKGAIEKPENVKELCGHFSALPYTRGLQTGMITPILNALRPDDFLLVNNKSRATINYFMETDYVQHLKNYPDLNIAGKELINSVPNLVDVASELNMRPDDTFDMFTHWLVAEKKFWKESVEIELTEEEPIAMNERILAEPFSSIFTDFDEAHWALDKMRDALMRAGITSSMDKRFAITIPTDGNPRTRVILGNWLLFGFVRIGNETFLQVALTTESSKDLPYDTFETFSRKRDDPECRLYVRIPANDLKSNKKLIAACEKSMPVIGGKFSHWRQTSRLGKSISQIAEAVFDPSKRDALLLNGLHEIVTPPTYTREECAKDTGLSEDEINRWLKAIERKKQAIIYGPPGTGKTYITQAIAKYLTAGTDGYVDIVQFHPSYSYEDFIQGIRPRTRADGTLEYQMTRGRFMEFCDEALKRSATCVLIVDEINRANLSRVFGELMYLMEYRDKTLTLAGGEEFSIPENVRIIGTMNTADRSIALVDNALRRRFAFLELYPNFEILRQYHQKTGCNVEGLIQVLEQLNRNIENSNYALGISYFMRQDLSVHLEDIWKTEIDPYLNEYFFDKPQRAAQFSWDSIKDKIAL